MARYSFAMSNAAENIKQIARYATDDNNHEGALNVIQAVLEGKAEELVLVNCCDSMRRVYDIVESTGKCKFLYMLDIPHDDEDCEKVKFAASICRLIEAYEQYSGKKFDKSRFLKAFEQKDTEKKPYIGVLRVRVSGVLEQMIRENIQMNVENLTCTGGRRLGQSLPAWPWSVLRILLAYGFPSFPAGGRW